MRESTAFDFSCQCAPGYFGALCAEATACASQPCQNGGTCEVELDDFVCTCAIGFSGASCETNINECASNPCLNGGTCADGLDSFVCNCVSGYTGTQCEADLDECASNPCTNGGSCVDLFNGFSCDCEDGGGGETCSAPAGLLVNPQALSGSTRRSGYVYNTTQAVTFSTISLATRFLWNRTATGVRRAIMFDTFDDTVTSVLVASPPRVVLQTDKTATTVGVRVEFPTVTGIVTPTVLSIPRAELESDVAEAGFDTYHIDGSTCVHMWIQNRSSVTCGALTNLTYTHMRVGHSWAISGAQIQSAFWDIRVALNLTDGDDDARRAIRYGNATMPPLHHLIVGTDGSGVPVDRGLLGGNFSVGYIEATQNTDRPQWRAYPGAASVLNDDRCVWGQCLNGATCVSSAYDFTCQCASGWTGLLCATAS
jgi:hypothetical protein